MRGISDVCESTLDSRLSTLSSRLAKKSHRFPATVESSRESSPTRLPRTTTSLALNSDALLVALL